MDAVEPFEPPHLYYRFKEGVWVSFRQSTDRESLTRRGHVKAVTDTHATVIDEHTFTEVSDPIYSQAKSKLHALQFNIDTRELEICEVQGPSLPKSDPIHPLVDKQVIVKRGPLKGLYGRIKDVGSEVLTVELEAKVAGSRNSRQPIKWTNLRVLYVPISLNWSWSLNLFRPKNVETSRTTTDTEIQPRTPSPPPDMTPPRDLTPEPVGASSRGNPHWLLSSKVQSVIQRRTITFYVKPTHSGDGALGAYKGCVARSVPFDQSDKIPRDGEIMVSVLKKNCRKIISVNPKDLVPLVPIAGGDVIVVSGILLGVVGVAKENQGKHWVVTFTLDGELADQTLEEKDLAPLE